MGPRSQEAAEPAQTVHGARFRGRRVVVASDSGWFQKASPMLLRVRCSLKSSVTISHCFKWTDGVSHQCSAAAGPTYNAVASALQLPHLACITAPAGLASTSRFCPSPRSALDMPPQPIAALSFLVRRFKAPTAPTSGDRCR